MDFSYLDNTVIEDEPPKLGSFDQIEEELAQLTELAENIGSYKWVYDGDDEVHDGVIAQELLKVTGLKDAVEQDEETGILTINSKFISLACLGYIAALTRVVIGMKEKENQTDGAINFLEQSDV